MRLVARMVAGLVGVVALVMLTASPSTAVLKGTFDSTNRYSNVGLVALNGEPLCTGTLYRTSPTQTSSNLVMTAAHCIVGFSGQYSVTFNPSAPYVPSTYYTGVGYSLPGYSSTNNNSLQQNSYPDLGVIVLDEPVFGISPADLPSIGVVDTFDVKTQQLTVVGYGAESFENANSITYGNRNYKDVTMTEGQRAKTAASYVRVSHGTCFGDSGGPLFVKGTRTIVAVASWVQSWVCGDHGYEYRIDTATTLNFLRNPTTVGIPQQ